MRISRIQIVAGFALNPNILATAGKTLQKIAKELGTNASKLSLPDSSPPEAPRAMIAGSTTLIQLCLNRAEIYVQPPDHFAGEFEASTEYAQQAANKFLLDFMTITRYEWTGVVATLNYPAKELMSQTAAATLVSDKLVNIKRAGRDLSHFNLQIGFKDGSIHVTYILSGYEIRTGSVGAAKPPSIDLSKVPVVESGIEVQLDVNNKPDPSKRGLKVDLQGVFEAQKAKYLTLREDLALEDLS